MPDSQLQSKDLLIAPVLEGALILIVAVIGWSTHRPLIFASIGPTAYELIEQPHRKSARPYSIVVGHLIAVIAGLIAVYGTGAWSVPAVSLSGVPLLRVWAATLAAALTVLGTLALRASQPAAVSTSLVVSLGSMQRWQDGLIIMAAILIITAFGEPLRIWRERTSPGE
jgi:CBS-domain-containing membrane protein